MPSARKLAKAGDVSSLISILEGDKERDATKAAESLAGFHDEAATDALVGAVLEQDSTKVRRAAAQALVCKAKVPEQHRALAALLEDDSVPKRLRRDVALALAVPSQPDSAAVIARLIEEAAPVRNMPFGVGPSLHVAPTLQIFAGPWQELVTAQLEGEEPLLFAVSLSETLGCVALEDRWVIVNNPRGAFTGLQDPFDDKVWIVDYADSLPLDFRDRSGEYVAFIRGSQHLRYSGFDVGQGAVKQAGPFFEWLDARHAGE